MPISSTWWGGNNYSTEEQVIGTWIDGKPIYQKTVILPSPRSTAWVQQFVVTCNITLAEYNVPDLDTLISGVAHCNGGVFNCGVNKSATDIVLSLLQTLSVIGCTIQYTKTTD